jgi:hypothetical protein
MHEHGRDPAHAPRQTDVARIVDVTGIERRLVNRRLSVRYLVEQKDCEVGGDQRDVDDREPARRNAIGVGDHAKSFRKSPPRSQPRRAADAARLGMSAAPSTSASPTILSLVFNRVHRRAVVVAHNNVGATTVYG